jgi:hypothetical protein
MAVERCLSRGLGGIVRIEDFVHVIQIQFLEKIPRFTGDQILAWGGKVICQFEVDDVLCVSHVRAPLFQAVRTAMECPVKHAAWCRILEVASSACCDDEIGERMVCEINRRLIGMRSISDWREEVLLEALKGVLGEWFRIFLLMWESHK